ncbi:MAG TPA: MFS transporter, partial [Polyangiaceae bacterium]
MTNPAPADPRARRVVWVVFVTVFLDLIGFGIVIPFLPLYVGTMGGSARTVGVLISCFSFTQLIATPLLGRLSDRVGRRKVILLSLAGNAASMVLFALAAKVNLLWLLFASRIVAGATAGNISACQAAIADVTEGPA